jgi:outer membrane receptor protein involved in Fe transport
MPSLLSLSTRSASTPRRAGWLALAAVALVALGARPVSAQGTIAGTVVDPATDFPVIGASVFVLGTTRGAATDVNGEFTIDGLSGGDYTVRVSYVGYQTKEFTGIAVMNGETTRLEIELEEAVLGTENEVIVVGDAPLIDVERAESAYTISQDQIESRPVRDVQDVIANQAGVTQDPTGLYIRGGRATETGYVVDGVSAKDPLAGTGFGLDLGSNALGEVEVVTTGADASVGDATSGVVQIRTREGTDTFEARAAVQRDNFGFNEDWESSFNEDNVELSLGGPIIPGRVRFFTSAQGTFSDGFERYLSTPDSTFYSVPDQVSSSIASDFWAPRRGNRWNGLGKLVVLPRSGMKLVGSYQRSLAVNQNTRMLQVTGNDAVVAPGFQYAFALQPDLANTYTQDSNLAYLLWTHAVGQQSIYEVQVSRLFTRLRADANGRDWRPENVDSELDPFSIPGFPGDIFGDPTTVPADTALFVLPGPGFVNNGGVATDWHDHFAEQLTARAEFTRFTPDESYEFTLGAEGTLNDYQWIDIARPWVGAPIQLPDGTFTQSNRLGQSSDIWRVKPRRAAFYTTHRFRYNGLIASLGGRFETWAAGSYVDDLVADSAFTIPTQIREAYQDETTSLFGLNWKARLLPKLNVSFPIRDNQVLFFSYGHSMRLPHPTYLYTNLDPFYQDRSFFSDLGNPNLDPEIDIAYELGVRNQITANDALNVTAFWRDKFDFITVASVEIQDPTGRETNRALRVNGDFARVRGIEVAYTKRIGAWFLGQFSGSYSRATGLSSTNNDALQDLIQDGNADNTFETPLAWDRPLDLKASVTLSHDETEPWMGIPGLNRVKLFVQSTFRSGQRYTPVEFVGNEVNPFTGERDWRPVYEAVDDPALRFSETGKPWWWFDLRAERRFGIGGSDLVAVLEVENLFNQKNSVIVNPVTGEAYPEIEPGTDPTTLRGNPEYDVPSFLRDPRFEDPSTSGLPPFNPARFLTPRHVVLGLSYKF